MNAGTGHLTPTLLLIGMITHAAPVAAQPASGAGFPSHPRETMVPPIGIAEVGLGWLTLPGAEVCVERSAASAQTDCKKGDSSLSIEAWQLFGLTPAFELGGGFLLGLTPTTDAPERDLADFERDHSRGYLTIEATARYHPYVGDRLSAWVGLTSGLAVVSDTFSTEYSDDRALVGPTGVTLRSEGFSVSLSGGFSYELNLHLSMGGTLRVGSWFLPQDPAVSPFGDEASLVGQINNFVLAVTIAYRVQL